jgi:glycosyltransferase involved in cell wall biosynthesis
MIPKISVILPSYNSIEFIDKSIGSILSQTYKNFELIVINDCSTDGTLEYLNTINDPRLVVINNDVNIGIVESLNIGVNSAKGEYIARMDADDISIPERLERQLNFIVKNNYDIVGAKARNFGKWRLQKVFPFSMSHLEASLALIFMNPLVHPLVMGRATIFKTNKYSKNFQWAEDYELWVRLVKKGYKLGVQDEILLNYRSHPRQISKINRLAQIKITKKIQTDYYNFLFPFGDNLTQPNALIKNLSILKKAYELSINSQAISKKFVSEILYEIGLKKINGFLDYQLVKQAYRDFGLSISQIKKILVLLLLLDSIVLNSRLRNYFTNIR